MDFRDIDRGWMIFTGMPQCPFGTMDNVGLDVVYNIERVYYNESRDPKDHPPEALRTIIEKGDLGERAKRVFTPILIRSRADSIF